MTSSFNLLKQAFASRMLSSTMNHSPLCWSSAISLTSTSSLGGLTEHSIFSTKGWALPVHTSLRFKKRQNNFLFKTFANCEHSGKKASPEGGRQNMRNFFDPVDYCSVRQTKSLFSCWSRDLRSSTLPDLAEKITSKGIFSLWKEMMTHPLNWYLKDLKE